MKQRKSKKDQTVAEIVSEIREHERQITHFLDYENPPERKMAKHADAIAKCQARLEYMVAELDPELEALLKG
jgi:hypothetical protein